MPGLSAAANHAFIPRNGLLTTAQSKWSPNVLMWENNQVDKTHKAVSGLVSAYNMSPELATTLAVISIALSGDPVSGRWSIGGKFTPTIPIFSANGIVGTHNKYEGDASIVRVSSVLDPPELLSMRY